MELTIDQALEQGVTAYKEGRFQEAERFYRAILRSKPKHAAANHNLGLIAVSFGKADAALPLFKTALETNPNKEQFWLSYVDALIRRNHLDNAQQAIQQAEKQGFTSEKLISFKELLAHYHSGVKLQEIGKFIEAEVSYRQAIAFSTGFIQAHRNLASTLRKLGKIEQALESERYAKFLNSSNLHASGPKNSPNNLPFKQPSPMEYPILYRPGMGTENIGGFLRAMAQMLRPKNILEIGAGYTTPFLLEALVNNERVYDDGNLEPSYFENYVYDSKLVVIDDMSLGELSNKPGMSAIISSKYTEFIEGNFEGKAEILHGKYGAFDFVWFDCGGLVEYTKFMDEYWDICSGYIFFHFTYTSGSPNEMHYAILKKMTGNPSVFDIVEPHKSRQGSITMVRKNDATSIFKQID